MVFEDLHQRWTRCPRLAQDGEIAHGTRLFTTCTDSVAAARSNVAPEIFRAMTRTVLLVQANAVRSVNRVELTSDAYAISPCRHPITVTSVSAVAPVAIEGRSQATPAWNSRVPIGTAGQA